jgi:hypothetical protein
MPGRTKAKREAQDASAPQSSEMPDAPTSAQAQPDAPADESGEAMQEEPIEDEEIPARIRIVSIVADTSLSE